MMARCASGTCAVGGKRMRWPAFTASRSRRWMRASGGCPCCCLQPLVAALVAPVGVCSPCGRQGRPAGRHAAEDCRRCAPGPRAKGGGEGGKGGQVGRTQAANPTQLARCLTQAPVAAALCTALVGPLRPARPACLPGPCCSGSLVLTCGKDNLLRCVDVRRFEVSPLCFPASRGACLRLGDDSRGPARVVQGTRHADRRRRASCAAQVRHTLSAPSFTVGGTWTSACLRLALPLPPPPLLPACLLHARPPACTPTCLSSCSLLSGLPWSPQLAALLRLLCTSVFSVC